MWQHLHIQKWVEDPFWKISQNGEPSYTWLHEAAAQEFGEPLCLPPLGHQQGGILTDILNHWDTKQHILQQLQEVYDSKPYLSSVWWMWKDMQLKRWSWSTQQHHTSPHVLHLLSIFQGQRVESQALEGNTLDELGTNWSQPRIPKMNHLSCRYSCSMTTLLFCYDLNSDR